MKKIFHSYYKSAGLIKAKEAMEIYESLPVPDESNEVLWRKYKETNDEEYIMQYIAKNRGYFVIMLANFFSKWQTEESGKAFSGILFLALKETFDRTNRYTKSYIARGVILHFMRAVHEKRGLETNVDEYMFEDEAYSEAVDRLCSYEVDFDYLDLFEVIFSVIDRNKGASRAELKKLIIQECTQKGLYLKLHEYLQAQNICLPELDAGR